MDTSSGDPGPEQDDQFILDDYDSDADERMASSKKLSDISGLSTSTLELLERFKEQFSAPVEDEIGHEDDDVKIFYCCMDFGSLYGLFRPSFLIFGVVLDGRGTAHYLARTERLILHVTFRSSSNFFK